MLINRQEFTQRILLLVCSVELFHILSLGIFMNFHLLPENYQID